MRAFLLWLCAITAFTGALASPWDEYAPYAQTLPALAPTPMGEGHLGQLASGQLLCLRFPVPAGGALAYRVLLGNVVAYTGRGQSYQLIVRADRPEGPIVYEGPIIANGDEWNAANREPIDLTSALRPEHQQQGYIDLYVTAIVTGDGWTLYRSHEGRPIVAQAVVLTPELRRRIEAEREMAARGIALLPQPQECELGAGEIVLAGFARKAETAEAQFLQAELNERVREMGLPALREEKAGARIWICLATEAAALAALRRQGFTAKPSGHMQGYTLEVNKSGVALVGDDAAGLFYGVQTLRQLLRTEGGKIRVPQLRIVDWAEYPLRGWQYDLARGQTINLDFCKRLIRETARHKMNCIMFYMEGDFKFEKYPFLGRPGTLDKQKALALDAYAAQYHVQLIPQYEALGHASATLQHEELKDLREAGSTWVYCTSEPKTWQFFTDIFGELAAAFPHSRYFHVGADEFEGDFAKCPRCQSKGIGPLYVEHMTKLNEICKQYGRKMLFWPSHRGPSPELSYLSLKHADKMPKDCIPTEWIYHGPVAYPEIAQYQQAGYEDVFVCPAVVDYSIIWPDYVTTFRGIKGFYEAGRARSLKRPCGGAICTTWELMYGGLYENSFYGLMWAAECGWSLGRTAKADFDRRFAADWLGLTAADAPQLIEQAFYTPIPTRGDAAFWRNGQLVRDLFWASPQDFRRRFLQRDTSYGQRAQALAAACAQWAQALQMLQKQARRNAVTLARALTACEMYRFVAAKIQTFEQAAERYAQAEESLRAQAPAQAAAILRQIATAFQGLREHLEPIRRDFAEAVATQGAYEADLTNIVKQQAALQALAQRLQSLADGLAADTTKQLPPAEELGLGLRQYVRVAYWEPALISETGKELRFDLTAFVKAAGVYRLEFEYTRGLHGLRMRDVRLLADGEIVARDEHSGWAGAGSHQNVFVLPLDNFTPGKKYEFVVWAASHGGVDSYGDIWLSVEEQRP